MAPPPHQALLQALGYPRAQTFSATDNQALRNLVVWLENVKVWFAAAVLRWLAFGTDLPLFASPAIHSHFHIPTTTTQQQLQQPHKSDPSVPS